MLPAAMGAKLVGLVIKFPISHLFSSHKRQQITEMSLRRTIPNISKFKRVL